MTKKNQFAVIISLVCFAAIVLSFRFPEKKTGFKNLKVLPKDITEKQLDSVMHYYTFALDVSCNTCHAKNSNPIIQGMDFASDTVPLKSRARQMITMTANINKTYFNDLNSSRPDTIKAVTCYTCHKNMR